MIKKVDLYSLNFVFLYTWRQMSDETNNKNEYIQWEAFEESVASKEEMEEYLIFECEHLNQERTETLQSLAIS